MLPQWEIYGMLAALIDIGDEQATAIASQMENEALSATSNDEWRHMLRSTVNVCAYAHFADGEDSMLEEISKHWPNEQEWLHSL